MSVITKGKTFANGEQLTAGKLNQMLDAAVFSSAAVDNTKTTLSGGAITIAPNGITATEIAQSFLDKIYPIGSIYTNATDGTNPGTLLGFGTWVSFGVGRVPVGIDSGDTDFDTAEETGGVKEVTLTSAQSGVPAHAHKFMLTPDSTVDSGNNGSIVVSGGGGVFNGVTGEPSATAGEQIGGNTAADATSAHTNLQPYIVVYMWKRTA
jgi:hypothetical protein